MIVKAVLVRHLPEKAERVADTFLDLAAPAITASIGDAQCRQRKPGGGDTRYGPRVSVVAIQQCPIFHLPGRWIRLIPKELKTGTLHLVKKLIIVDFRFFGRKSDDRVNT